MFSTLRKSNFNFLVTFILSIANAFNLDQSRIFWFGKELTVAQVIKFVLKRVNGLKWKRCWF